MNAKQQMIKIFIMIKKISQNLMRYHFLKNLSFIKLKMMMKIKLYQKKKLSPYFCKKINFKNKIKIKTK